MREPKSNQENKNNTRDSLTDFKTNKSKGISALENQENIGTFWIVLCMKQVGQNELSLQVGMVREYFTEEEGNKPDLHGFTSQM